ncbi:proteasome subunit beta type-4-like [Gigantopelta aegis]|uniref:proteasome subunit beta type-4-like n=1 Tax=Gigantopelta aegis TaxID=1735272 RepID=UPI001B88A6E7|nr:proteasome subunit beta type-4-like [Gigantopelta aegis]
MATYNNFHEPSPLWTNGPQPGSFFNLSHTFNSGTKRTMQPVVTGSSVLGLQFDGGVMIAADMLGSYGSLARFRNVSRVLKVNDKTILGAGGDFADFQFMKAIIEQRVIDEECLNDGFGFTPKSLHSWLTRVLYNRRSQFNPLWNVYVIGGIEDGEPYLGYVDKIGVAYTCPSIASGYGAYMAQPMMRDELARNPNMSQAQAEQVIDRCLKLLFYRDARSLNKYQVAIVTKDGVKIIGPIVSETNWEIAHLVKGYE